VKCRSLWNASHDTSTIASTAVLGSALIPLMLSLFIGRKFKQCNAHSARIGTDQPPAGAKIETKRYETEGGNISSILLAGGRIKEGGHENLYASEPDSERHAAHA
jgi:hypothetical protein